MFDWKIGSTVLFKQGIVTYLGGSYYKFNSLYTDCSTNKLIFLGEL